MRYIECPSEYERTIRDNPVVFMAGGITNCPPWHTKMKLHLEKEDIILLNPRRVDFDASDPKMENAQIEWEYRHFQKLHPEQDAVLFWFPCETLCPITLFELGDTLARSPLKVFVGCHPDYKRIRDIRKQISLRRKEIEVVESLEELADQIKAWTKNPLLNSHQD